MAEKRTIKHLSNKELDKVMKYVSYLLVDMGIGTNFQVIVRAETAGQWYSDSDDDADNILAGIETADQKFSADLFLCEGWESLIDEQKANSLIHEMIHIIHHRVDLAVYDHMDIDWLPPRVAQAGKTLYMREMEMVVDRMARLIQRSAYEWSMAAELPLLPSVVVQGNHI